MTTELLPELSYTPKLRLILEDLTHEASASFTSLIDCQTLLTNAIKHIIANLYTPYGRESMPKTRSVTLILRSKGGVAYTTGIELDEMHKEIHISLEYLSNFCKQPLRFRDEAIGVVTHEMVHAFQHNCHGTAPGGLIEGIADFVRLKAGLSPPHWQKGKGKMGKKWDEGYQVTAWFLDWLETNRGAGTVSKINEMMGRCTYDEDKFWTDLFGMKIDVLYKRYQASWGEDEKDIVTNEKVHDDEKTDVQKGTPIYAKPEAVDMNAGEKHEAQVALHPKEWKA